VAYGIGFIEIDLVDLQQRKIALAILRRPYLALDGVARAQPEPADLAGADIDIVGSGQIVRFGRPQEAETVLQHLQDAVAVNSHFVAGQLFKNREHHILLAQRARILDFKLLGIAEKFRGGFLFKVLEMHVLLSLGIAGAYTDGYGLNGPSSLDFRRSENSEVREGAGGAFALHRVRLVPTQKTICCQQPSDKHGKAKWFHNY
jgi:hypothetical protein